MRWFFRGLWNGIETEDGESGRDLVLEHAPRMIAEFRQCRHYRLHPGYWLLRFGHGTATL